MGHRRNRSLRSEFVPASTESSVFAGAGTAAGRTYLGVHEGKPLRLDHLWRGIDSANLASHRPSFYPQRQKFHSGCWLGMREVFMSAAALAVSSGCSPATFVFSAGSVARL